MVTRHAPTLEDRPASPGSGSEFSYDDPGDLDNAAWIAERVGDGGVVLLGGVGLTDFRVRVAQSRLRQDMTPSHWSLAGIREGDGLWTARVHHVESLWRVAEDNATERVLLEEFADPARYPNVAAVEFTTSGGAVLAAVERLRSERAVVDLVPLLPRWIGFVLGVEGFSNPIADGHGVPSGALVEAAFGLAGLDITPGLIDATPCPEVIWQAARFWRDYYAGLEELEDERDPDEAPPMPPRGAFTVRHRLVPDEVA